MYSRVLGVNSGLMKIQVLALRESGLSHFLVISSVFEFYFYF